MKIIFEKDGTDVANYIFPYIKDENADVGKHVIVTHMTGVIYDAWVIRKNNEFLAVGNLKINKIFYNEVQKAYVEEQYQYIK